jgi:hypothetical protein
VTSFCRFGWVFAPCYNRRMSVRRQMAAAWVALLMCLVTGLLWARSYFCYDFITYNYIQSSLNADVASVHFVNGGLEVTLNEGVTLPAGTSSGWAWMDAHDWLYWQPQESLFESMTDFHWINQRGYWIPGNLGVASRRLGIQVPIWSAAIAWLTWPVAMLLHARRKVQWGVRRDIRWTNPQLRWRVKRFAKFAAAGVISGAALIWVNFESSWWQLN